MSQKSLATERCEHAKWTRSRKAVMNLAPKAHPRKTPTGPGDPEESG